MNFYEKLNRFRDLIALNDRCRKSNTLHISLNFDPSERLGKENLTAIANCYMSKIGFGDQPYLVYQHFDAGHPHIHIVTTNIEADGKRINTYNIGRNQSEKARKEIEQEFRLLKASRKIQTQQGLTEAVNVQKLQYGKSETKRSITNVLDTVINQYKYTSLAELNAILKQYNLVADRGNEAGRIYKTGGLLYKVLDANGNKTGVPIKASSIYCKPTLKNLEQKFAENEIRRNPDKQKLKNAIDWTLSKPMQSVQSFIQALQKEKVQAVVRQNEKGFIYGITFIDFRTKSVFNGSDLGKQYSAAGLQAKINQAFAEKSSFNKSNITLKGESKQMETMEMIPKENLHDLMSKNPDLIDLLLKTERNEGRLPYHLLPKRKKKKRNPGLL